MQKDHLKFKLYQQRMTTCDHQRLLIKNKSHAPCYNIFLKFSLQKIFCSLNCPKVWIEKELHSKRLHREGKSRKANILLNSTATFDINRYQKLRLLEVQPIFLPKKKKGISYSKVLNTKISSSSFKHLTYCIEALIQVLV